MWDGTSTHTPLTNIPFHQSPRECMNGKRKTMMIKEMLEVNALELVIIDYEPILGKISCQS